MIKRQCESMRRVLFIAIALTFLSASGSDLAADKLCKQVKSFEQAPLTKLPDGGLQRRWMDFSWGAPENLAIHEVQIGSTLKCQGSDDAAKMLCKYVLHNTPHENMTALPHGLIEQIQIDQLARRDAEPSMRLTMMPFPESSQAKTPAPFFKALSAKLDLWDQGAE